MKKFIVIIIGVFLIGCSQDNPEAIRKKIISNQNKVNALNEQIAVLQEELKGQGEVLMAEKGTVVTVQEVTRVPFKHYIQVSGKVIAEKESYISPEINGQISDIHVEEGQKVRKGQLLVSLNTDLTEKSVKELQTSMELLKSLYDKQKKLWDQNIGTEVQYLQAKTNLESGQARLATLEEQLDMAKVTAPFDGVVEDIPVKRGEMAMPGARLVHLVNLKDLSIEADISENYLNQIKKGEVVDVEFPGNQDLNKTLVIKRIGSVIENMSRTFQIELELFNPDEKIKPNQLAVLKINDFSSDAAFIVPTRIIKQDITGYYVYQVTNETEGSVARKLYVVPGLSDGDRTMIDEGLTDGLVLIVDGYNLVKDGSVVQILNN